ncbi:MAG: alpha-E domain-containing protein [Magnetospirillum gryphiswaldense]|nr:alpha-E domain-containing protein [Magnetospirillum gryphiswaldense]
MLSRTAEHLYWMSRYMERAENIARFLDVANRTAMSSPGNPDAFWRSVLSIAGGEKAFNMRYSQASAVNVVSYTVLDATNPSSIYAALRSTRENAHAVRSVIPNELWEATNATWLEVKSMDGPRLREQGLIAFCEWVRERSHLFRGIVDGVMLRDEPYHFLRLGTALERADNTARLIGVPLGGFSPGGAGADPFAHTHWAVVLRSVSALKAYRTVYRDEPRQANALDMLIQKTSMPRSLSSCLDKTMESLMALGPDLECTRMVGSLQAKLHWSKMDELLADGLKEFVTSFITVNNHISTQLHEDFLMSA